MPCDYVVPEDRGKADKVRSALEVILADGRRYRHGELVDQIVKLGQQKRTAERWIKSATEQGILNNNSGIYSLSLPS